jgi:hypothetical protein
MTITWRSANDQIIRVKIKVAKLTKPEVPNPNTEPFREGEEKGRRGGGEGGEGVARSTSFVR